VVAGLTHIELFDTCMQCMEFCSSVCGGLFINVDAWWVAGWSLASHTLGCVEYNFYHMLTTYVFINAALYACTYVAYVVCIKVVY